jgi:uncharacterized Ntn-hydrolase superfamily protein
VLLSILRSNKMKKHILISTLLLFLSNLAFSTWSIIIIDPLTKEIGIAGASCSFNCYGIGKIVPNIGAVIVQAMSNNQAREKGIQLLLTEASPEQIIQALKDPVYDPERQQYAVVSIKYIDNPATYTGDSTHLYNGALTATGVSVQGNTLANENELQLILDAVTKGKSDHLPIAEILMNALEAGGDAGGDKRCGDQKAASAFIIVAAPDSKKPYLDLNIFGQHKGGQNAVTMMRNKFEKWKRKHQPSI